MDQTDRFTSRRASFVEKSTSKADFLLRKFLSNPISSKSNRWLSFLDKDMLSMLALFSNTKESRPFWKPIKNFHRFP